MVWVWMPHCRNFQSPAAKQTKEKTGWTRQKTCFRSHRSGERVTCLLRRLYAKLHLTVSGTQSAVSSVFGRFSVRCRFQVEQAGPYASTGSPVTVTWVQTDWHRSVT